MLFFISGLLQMSLPVPFVFNHGFYCQSFQIHTDSPEVSLPSKFWRELLLSNLSTFLPIGTTHSILPLFSLTRQVKRCHARDTFCESNVHWYSKYSTFLPACTTHPLPPSHPLGEKILEILFMDLSFIGIQRTVRLYKPLWDHLQRILENSIQPI